jgi:beta-lactamase superfamily II metal-dependent hydrolase
MGIKAYATNLHGNISVTSDGHKIDVSADASNLFPMKEKV